jgi:hypothetical protein
MNSNGIGVVNVCLIFGLIGLGIEIWDKIKETFNSTPMATVITLVILVGGITVIKKLFK